MVTKRQVVSTAEAADILGMSTATIRRMHKRGDLKGFLSKGMGRITVASIEELLGEPIRWGEDEPTTGSPRVIEVDPEAIANSSTPTETPEGDTP